RPLQQGTDAGNVRAFKSDLGEAVLGDLHRCASLPGLLAQDLHLGNREAGIVSHDDGVGGLEDLLQFRHLLGFCRSFHKLSPVGGSRRSGTPSRRLHVPSLSTRHAAAGTTIGALPLARIPAPGPTVRTDTDPIARTKIGLTRLCRLSIKPELPAPAVLDRTRPFEFAATSSSPS